MSKRRNIGDIVWINEIRNLWYRCQIPDVGENKNYVDACFSDCDDVECREWPTLWILNCDGHAVGVLYHIAECEMFDEKGEEDERRKDQDT